jgi:hypothetical protein
MNMRKGDTFEMPLSAFSASRGWAENWAEFTDNGDGVIIRLEPGAISTPTTMGYDLENPSNNNFEVVTAGRFEVVDVEEPEGEQKINTIRQIETFDPAYGKYSKIGKRKRSQKAGNQRLSGQMSEDDKTPKEIDEIKSAYLGDDLPEKIGTVTTRPVGEIASDEFALPQDMIPVIGGGERYVKKRVGVFRLLLPIYDVGGRRVFFGDTTVRRLEPGPSFDMPDYVEIIPFEQNNMDQKNNGKNAFANGIRPKNVSKGASHYKTYPI